MDEEEERKKKSGVAPTVAPPAKLGILGMKKGGAVKKFARGGGIEVRGKTRGRIC